MDAGFNAKHIDEFRSGWAASASNDVQFYETERVVFRYRENAGPEGAPTIVFCADPPVTLEQYDELIDLASCDFRVTVFELPGMGFSPGKRCYRFGFRETNDEVAGFLASVAGPGSVLAFSCAAGLAAIDLSNRRPELVSALALIQTTDVAGFARWKASRDPKGILSKPILGQLAMRTLARKRMPAWFSLSLGREDQEEQFCSCADASMDKGALWSLASAYQVYLRSDVELTPVAQRALAIWGELDRSHTQENRDAIRSVAPEATIHSFKNLGHFPELQEPGTIYPLIRDWYYNHGA